MYYNNDEAVFMHVDNGWAVTALVQNQVSTQTRVCLHQLKVPILGFQFQSIKKQPAFIYCTIIRFVLIAFKKKKKYVVPFRKSL